MRFDHKLGQCPFPGVPANAYGLLTSGSERNISWDDRETLFKAGDTIVFNCIYNKMEASDQPTITCQKNSTWAGSDMAGNLRCDGSGPFIHEFNGC